MLAIAARSTLQPELILFDEPRWPESAFLVKDIFIIARINAERGKRTLVEQNATVFWPQGHSATSRERQDRHRRHRPSGPASDPTCASSTSAWAAAAGGS